MKNNCIFCCDDSISHPNRHSVRFPQYHTGIVCKKCSKVSCKQCLFAIVDKMDKNHLRDDWYDSVLEYLPDSTSSLRFVCSFCECSVNLESSKPHMPRRFDGYLFLPDYALMICPNFAGLDIIALGEDRPNNLDAVLHAVVDEEVSIKCESQNVVPDRSAASIVDMYTKQITFHGRDCKVCDYCMFMSVCIF